jgi:hypothetical protein
LNSNLKLKTTNLNIWPLPCITSLFTRTKKEQQTSATHGVTFFKTLPKGRTAIPEVNNLQEKKRD